MCFVGNVETIVNILTTREKIHTLWSDKKYLLKKSVEFNLSNIIFGELTCFNKSIYNTILSMKQYFF